MALVDLDAILAELQAANSFLVTTHVSPDGDAIGSALAMCHLLRALGRQNVSCVLADPVPKMYDWLPGVEAISNNADAAQRSIASSSWMLPSGIAWAPSTAPFRPAPPSS